MLGLPDGGLSEFQVLGELVSKIEKVIADLRPDAIVTWGPEGGYGHADHRLVSAAVTQIVQAGEATPLLYYAALPAKGLTPDVSSALKLPVFKQTDETFLNTRVPYSEEDEAKARAALACHKSQFTPETMQRLSALGRRVNNGVNYLRSWSGGPERTDLFGQ
ncbi:MAG: PIG-L deacetylase family protein [Vicinamibacteraceae bacterium]